MVIKYLSPPSTDKFLKILILFLYTEQLENNIEATENCLRFPRNVSDFQKLFKNSENYLRISRTAWDFLELSKNRKTAWDFWELFEIYRSCLRLPRTV